jgi:hypothetical protein
MARPSLDKAKRARRYLEASMEAGYTGLPAKHHEAKHELMRSHERAYRNVREHALAGSDADFDQPLSAGAREHQRALREKEGLTHGEVLRMRRELRAGEASGSSSGDGSGSERSQASRLAGAYGDALSTGASELGAGGGNTLLKLIGVGLLLSLIYLLVAGKGANALAGLSKTLTGAVRGFVAPTDPLKQLQGALGASTTPAGSSGGAGASLGPAPALPTPVATGASAARSGRLAPSPAVAGSLTPSGLTRAIKAHKLTPKQVKADLEILYPGAYGK